MFSLCACGQASPEAGSSVSDVPAGNTSADAPAADVEIPDFGEYTGLSEFLSGNTVSRVVYRPGTMGSDEEFFVEDSDVVARIVAALQKVSISGATYSSITDWYPSITLEAENGASVYISFDGEWLAGYPVNYTLSGMGEVWKLIKANAKEPEPMQSGDFLYELLEDGSAEITGYIGEGGDVEVPADFDGIPVSSIGYEAFLGNKDIVRISLPSSVSCICRQAFAYCDGISRIEFSCADLEIMSNAFEYCDGLSEIVIDCERVSIGSGAFHYCKALKTVEISAEDISIARAAFEYDRALSKVSLLCSRSAEINEKAFAYCENAGFIVAEGSDAETYCKDNNLPYSVK